MVRAVSPSGDTQLIDLKFSIDEKPEVGKPLTIQLALTPVAKLERIFATFQGSEGLVLGSGGQLAQIDNPTAGVVLAHRISVTPSRDGIFYISATVLADTAEQSITRNFSIPIIAGAGIASTP